MCVRAVGLTHNHEALVLVLGVTDQPQRQSRPRVV